MSLTTVRSTHHKCVNSSRILRHSDRKAWNILLRKITGPHWCVPPHPALFCVTKKATPHSQEEPLYLLEFQSHFKQQNKAGSLASLTGISSLQSQNLQPLNDEAEPCEGVLAYDTVDENTLKRKHGRHTLLLVTPNWQRRMQTGTQWFWAYWRHLLHHGTVNVLLMHYTCIHYPPASCTNLCTETRTFTFTGAQTEGWRKKVQWIMDLFIKIWAMRCGRSSV